jgi:hypothetical protein
MSSAPRNQTKVYVGFWQYPAAQCVGRRDSNLCFAGGQRQQQTGMRLFGGRVGGRIPEGFVCPRDENAGGLQTRVDTANV